MKKWILFILIAAIFFLQLGCKKTSSTESNIQVAENISIYEIKEWGEWYEKSITGAPKMKMDQLQKRVWKGRFFVRVPLENSKGMIYFTKENSLQAVFIRQNYNNKAIPTELSNSELIDLNLRSIRTITYKNNKADSLYTFVANQSPQSSNRYTIMSGTFWQDLACLLTFGSPYWAMDNSRQCARGINWGSIGTFLASVFFY